MKSKVIFSCGVLVLIPVLAYSTVPANHFAYVQASPFTSISGFDLGGHVYDAGSNTVLISGGTGVRNYCFVDTPSSSSVLTFGFNFQGYGYNHYGTGSPGFDQDERNPSWDFTGEDHYEDYLTMIREIGGQYSMWDSSNFPCEFWYTDPSTMGSRVTAWSFSTSTTSRRYF